MKSEEMAVLRILYKHRFPLKLPVLIEGFPDELRGRIIDAISYLQLLSYLSITDCSSVLYVSINRQAKRTVLDLLESDAKRFNTTSILENRLHLNNALKSEHSNTNSDPSYKADLKVPTDRGLRPRLPQLALKLGTILVFSFVVVGTFTFLSSQSTTSSSSTYDGFDENSPTMLASSSFVVAEIQKARTIPIEHVHNSEHYLSYTDEPAVYEGIFTKLGSQPKSSDVPPVYYHYVISEMKGLLLLEQISPGFAGGDSNSSLTAMSGERGKEFSTT